MHFTSHRRIHATGIFVACVIACISARMKAEPGAAPDGSTPESVLKASNHAELTGDGKTLRAVTYFTAAWEKTMAADIDRGAARAKMTKTLTTNGAWPASVISSSCKSRPPSPTTSPKSPATPR